MRSSKKSSSFASQVKIRSKKDKTFYLVSDSSGNLLEHFFNAILTQFPPKKFHIESHPFIRSRELFIERINRDSSGIVFHAVVADNLKRAISEECKKRNIPCWDVTGPTVKFIEKAARVKVSSCPRPIHQISTGYMGRMRALEFAMQHDDGRRIEEVGKAEIVLVGISRVSKSPTSLFLAYRGFSVANVSIVPCQGIPEALDRHCGKNVVAFTMTPKRLSEIRQRRFSGWKIENFQYEDLPSVIREVMDAEKLYRRKGWPIIDTTDLAVEETSSLVLSKLGLAAKEFN